MFSIAEVFAVAPMPLLVQTTDLHGRLDLLWRCDSSCLFDLPKLFWCRKAYTEKYDHVKRPWKVSENMLKRRSKTRVLMQESKAFSVTYFFMVAFVTYSWYGPTGNQMVNVFDTFEKVAPLHAVIRTALCTTHVVNSLIVWWLWFLQGELPQSNLLVKRCWHFEKPKVLPNCQEFPESASLRQKRFFSGKNGLFEVGPPDARLQLPSLANHLGHCLGAKVS